MPKILKVPPGWEAATLNEGFNERRCNAGFGIGTLAMLCDGPVYVPCPSCVFYGAHLQQLLDGVPYTLEFIEAVDEDE